MRWLLSLLVLWCSIGLASAQFYSTGRGNPFLKLDEIKTNDYRLIFPQSYAPSAERLGRFLDTIRPYISTGIGVAPRRLPIILHTKNVYSNGYVTWAPRREELVMIPPASTYAMPWSRQLAIHEWRHVTQITALNHGLTRIASWLLGEAGYSLGLAVMSRWQLEGDATLAETQFSEFGRALQPSFTVGYRALFDDGRKSFRYIDPWACGSYNRAYPNLYHYGYQVMSAAETYINKDIWGEVLRYSGKWPIFIFPDAVLLKHKYKTSYHKIANRAFAELDSLWSPLAKVDENFEQRTTEKRRTYIKYDWPLATRDFGVVAFKNDWNLPPSIVSLQDSSRATDRPLFYPGTLSSRATSRGNSIYWTEYVPHPIYEQESFSVIRSLDLTSGRARFFERTGRNYFVTPIDSIGFASVALDDQLHSYIQFFDRDFNRTTLHSFGSREISLHGMAWDSLTDQLIFIALDDRGMYIGALNDSGRAIRITEPSVVTVSDLSAKDGRIYFSSIESGKNEIHSIDLRSGVERRLTESKFGSNAPSVVGDSLFFTTTRAKGEMVATTIAIQDSAPRVYFSRLPQNKVNPVRYKWPVPTFDTVHIPQKETQGAERKRFFRAAHALNIHSWAPVSFDGDFLTGERDLQLALGVTAFLQSTMSDLQGFATYGYVNHSNWVKGSIQYKGLPLTIDLSAEHGGGDQVIYGFGGRPRVNAPYTSVGLTFSLPLNFSSGSSLRLLQPSLSIQYSNALLVKDDAINYDRGLARYEGSLWWSSTRRASYRSIVPRLGYALRLNVAGAFYDRFATWCSIWGRAYLPGVAPNHSITLKAATQYQSLSDLNFQSKVITPRGYSDTYVARTYSAATIDYTAPVAYPDWGWDGVIFLKRIWVSAFGDVSCGDYVSPFDRSLTKRVGYSYGLNVGFDLCLMRSFDQSFSIMLAMPKRQGLFFGINYSFNLK